MVLSFLFFLLCVSNFVLFNIASLLLQPTQTSTIRVKVDVYEEGSVLRSVSSSGVPVESVSSSITSFPYPVVTSSPCPQSTSPPCPITTSPPCPLSTCSPCPISTPHSNTTSTKPQPIIYPVVGTSLYDSSFPNQIPYTSYLKRITPDFSLPFIVNVDVYQLDHSLEFYIVINTMHLNSYQSMQHTNYTLHFQNIDYSNQFDRRNTDVGYNVLKFIVPIQTPFTQNQPITFTLVDNQKKWSYNLIGYIRFPNPNPLPIGVCAYVSDYNSIEELRMWIAFYRVQKVSLVILYMTVPMPELEREFRDLIETGYVQLVDFTWPRKSVFKHIQRSNQQAQINSCFYHYKYEVKSLILCDTDEFIFSEQFPSDLAKLSSFLESEYPKNDVFHMLANRYLNKQNDLSHRLDYLRNGTLFDAYPYLIGYSESGARKMIVRNWFDGYLGTHVCQYCHSENPLKPNVAKIGHFKVAVYPKNSPMFSGYLSRYSRDVRKMMKVN